jgi:hypothetical protein
LSMVREKNEGTNDLGMVIQKTRDRSKNKGTLAAEDVRKN